MLVVAAAVAAVQVVASAWHLGIVASAAVLVAAETFLDAAVVVHN